MPAHIDSAGRLHDSEAANLSLICPHCQQRTHITPLAVPNFQYIVSNRPLAVGIVYSCDACHASIFLRYGVRVYGDNRIELAPQFQQVERARERFPFNYLPAAVEQAFKEALLCHAAEANTAFALMCRQIVQAIHQDQGDASRLRMFEQINDVREMLELDEESFVMIKRALFGHDARDANAPPTLTSWQASLLLEVIKDLLSQAYVRKARLQQALLVRNYFTSEARVATDPRAGANK